LRPKNDHQGYEQAEDRGNLNEAGVKAVLVVGHMFGDVNRSAAIFATQRQALQDAD